MKKPIKVVISGMAAIIVGYFMYALYGILVYSHSIDYKLYKGYLWLFKDSVRNNIDTDFCYSYAKKRDTYNNFHYKGIYNVIIWEFKDLDVAQLNRTSFKQNVNLNNLKLGSYEVLNKKDEIEISIKYGFAFDYNINVNLDEYSKVERNLMGVNYKGFYGTINEMSLSNKKGEHQILFNYVNGATPTVLLFYKNHKSFYLIMINCEKPFDESILNILNLQ